MQETENLEAMVALPAKESDREELRVQFGDLRNRLRVRVDGRHWRRSSRPASQ
jgi:hypothetical protein